MQPSQQPQHSIDYLDSISTAPKKPAGAMNDKLFFGAIIGGVLLILLAGLFVFFSSGTSSKEDLARLDLRLQNLQKVSDGARNVVISSELRATNINLSLALTNANRDSKAILKAGNISSEKVSSSITSQESTEQLTEKLEDARLNAIYDRVYAREMTYELSNLLILIEQLQAKVKVSEQKEFLSTLHTNIEPLQKQFDSFGSTQN